ncbi:uncharacterized protein LOC142337766 isoform X2 [Convolutriloba macropyga]|uniref:uncharacterized protein LOC142337766 isoform X2 n=1 Tax=Convolutriloba macropyga TaxID=536237 RepID=UPI003F528515
MMRSTSAKHSTSGHVGSGGDGWLPSLFGGGGLWTRAKTKAEYEAERMNRIRKGTLQLVLISIAIKLWISLFHNNGSIFTNTDGLVSIAPTVILALAALMQLQHLKSTKVVLKNKDSITERSDILLWLLLDTTSIFPGFDLPSLGLKSSLWGGKSSHNSWASSGILCTAVMCHFVIHRVMESVIHKSSSLHGLTICDSCRKNPSLTQRVRDHLVLTAGVVGYVYIMYCYATSTGVALGLTHSTVMVVTSVIFEWSAAKMVHFCLKHAELVRLQGRQTDNLLALLTFVASHVTLFRGYFCPEQRTECTQALLWTDAIRYAPQLLLWLRAFNAQPPKVSTSWFSPCVVCSGK